MRTGVLVGAFVVAGHEQVKVRRGFVDLDPHVIDHIDDILDLLGIDDLVRQVFVDLVVGQEALFLTLGNQELDL